MTDFFLIAIPLIWLFGAWLRIYRQARFYQIEEYQSRRYLHWLLVERERWLPTRPTLAWLIGAALSLVLAESPGSPLPGVINLFSAIVAILPPREREVKKPFRRTARATRLLAAAFVVTLLMLVFGLLVASTLPLGSMVALRLSVLSFIGWLAFLLAPLALVLGTILMSPVEALFRQRYLQQARRILAKVHPKVVGITGSYGKTSTKHILAQLLNGRFHALPTPKSYNTLMGICSVINNTLADDYSVEYFIVEMGAYVEGEIAAICDLVHPQVGIVVDVGPQHLERFGTLANTARAKYELIKALPPAGVGVFNWDSPLVREMYEKGYPATRLAVSKSVAPSEAPQGGPRFVASAIEEGLDGLSFAVADVQTGESQPFTTPLLGEHNVTNILLATAVAVHEGMLLRDVALRVRTLQPAESRLARQTTPEGITIINDAYSANPVGALHSLRVLGLHTTGKRVLITPGMVELGPLMESENRKLGRAAAGYATDIILVGAEQTKPVKAGLLEAGFPQEHLQVVETLAESVNWYQHHLGPGDAVLFLNDLPDVYS